MKNYFDVRSRNRRDKFRIAGILLNCGNVFPKVKNISLDSIKYRADM